jgi:excinuclease ABC subunit C
MEKDMMKLAKNEQFEEASIVKRKIFALNHIQDIALVKDDYKNFSLNADTRVEAYDVAHMSGKDMVGVMVVVQNGEAIKSEYRKFKINSLKQANDPAALKEMLDRRLKHTNWPLPSLIVVDGNIIQINAAKAMLEQHNLDIKIAAVVKDDRHKASKIIADAEILKKHKFDILLSNAEAHRFAIGYYRNLARKSNLK